MPSCDKWKLPVSAPNSEQAPRSEPLSQLDAWTDRPSPLARQGPLSLVVIIIIPVITHADGTLLMCQALCKCLTMMD